MGYKSDDRKKFLVKAKKRVDDKDEYEKYKNELINEMKNFDEYNNHELLEPAYGNYKKANNPNFNNNYIKMYEKDLKVALSQCKILILTANPIEKAIFHHCIIKQKRYYSINAKM